MKKLVLSVLLLLICLFPIKVLAASDTVENQAGLLTESEISQLNSLATDLNQAIKGQVFILTTNSNTETPRKFANQSLKKKVGEDGNGALLLIDMNQREIYLSTSGNMIDYLSDKRVDQILDDVQAAMADSDYFTASQAFLQKAHEYVKAGPPSGTYRIDEATGKVTYYKSITPLELTISLVVASVIALAFFLVTKWRYQMKTGNYRYGYRQNAQLNLEDQKDQLVNSFVTTRRIPKQKNNGNFGGGGGSSTNSSGGGTFGGGGRSF